MQRLYSLLVFSVPVLMAGFLIGCNESAPTAAVENSSVQSEANDSPETVNAICPIMGGKVATDGGTADWNGKLVGFCCPGCEPKWEKLTDDQKSEKLVATKENAEEDGDHADHDHS